MTQRSPDDISNPLFVRFYRSGARQAKMRGETEYRRRALEGISGRVLELGCAEGANFELYPSTVDEVIAIEPEPRFRERAELNAVGAAVPIRVMPGTGESLPVDDGSIDAYVASLVLCTVPDQASALAEARRALRPGGELRFYEHVHAREQPLRGFLEVAYRTRIWPLIGGGCNPTRDTLAAIRTAGFEVERCELVMFRPSFLTPTLPHILGAARAPR